MKKVTFVVTKGNFGGAQKYVLDLARALPKEDFLVSVITGIPGLLNEKLQEAGVHVSSLKHMERDISVWKEFLAFFELWAQLRREKPDIVHLNSSKAGGLGALVARLVGVKKIIFTAHGWPFKEARDKTSRGIIWFFSWLTVILSTDVIVISKADLASGEKMPFVRKKLYHIYNGVIERQTFTRDEARRKLLENTNVKEEKLWVGAIAELTKNKGLEYLIRAIPSLKTEATVCVIGEGEEHKHLEALIKELNLSEKVILKGFLDHAAAYLSAFDIFVLPSLKEGHPYTVLEAGVRGVAVVGSDIPGIRDIITDKCGILVPVRDPARLAKAIDELLSNNYRRNTFGLALQKRVKEEFGQEEMVGKTIAIYQT